MNSVLRENDEASNPGGSDGQSDLVGIRILVTGGAGFIGSNLVRYLLGRGHRVLNLDKLTYAGNRGSLAAVVDHPHYRFLQADIGDAAAVADALGTFQPEAVIHLAAESHVDRSIDGPMDFVQSNVVGTVTLLQVATAYWRTVREASAAVKPAWTHADQEEVLVGNSGASTGDGKPGFRFVHVSTDEVYGSLGQIGRFSETTGYDPHSPYSASKAASDHFARAWHDTYGLPVVVTHCSNNYGPYQFPEKLIPVVILKCLRGEPIPVYGNGENVRDWLFVDDHCVALERVALQGRPGTTYNIGGNRELRNIDLVRLLCQLMDRLSPETIPAGAASHAERIEFVPDRPGHDWRYAIDASKIQRELGWTPSVTAESGFEQTVRWYLENRSWWESSPSGRYQLGRQGLGVGATQSRHPESL